jgi:Zn-dependent peptidase ImmA (M78 family)
MKTELTLDPMELADVGGQPRKLAAEIHRQLRAQQGNISLPIPLAQIAAALGVEEIVERETTTFEGMLVASADKSRGGIVLRKGMQRGRRNFTLGHEIGHFVNPYHKPPPAGFVCVREGLAGRRADGKKWDQRSAFERMEIEANEFSVALMVPTPEFRKSRERLSGSDLRHIQTLANLFATSKEVMSRIYVDTSPEKIGIVTSLNGQLRSFILPPSFPYLGLGKGRPLPSRSLSEHFLKTATPGGVSGLLPISADVWLDRSPRNVELFEQVIAQRDGFAITLLRIQEPDEDEADEQEEVERRWSATRFAYGR